MTGSVPLDLALLAILLVVQMAAYVVLGDLVGRLAGFRFLRSAVPEVAFAFGLPAYSLIGYLVLAIAHSAKAIPIAIVLTALAIWAYGKAPAPPTDGFLERYKSFRSSPMFWLSVAGIVVLTVLVSLVRLPWLLSLHSTDGMVSGTGIFDDTRSLGIPLSLAAFGFPPRSPIAMGMYLPYPLGAFIYSAGLIAWLPSVPLPILLADVVAQTLFYGIGVLFTAAIFLSDNFGRLLVVATASLGASFNLWRIGLNRKSPIVLELYGYFQYNGLLSTIAWTPWSGLVWISNHTMSFASLLLAASWFAKNGNWRAALLFASFTAVTSVDMITMGLAAAGLLIGATLVQHLVRRQPLPAWVWQGIGICACCVVLTLVVNAPALLGQVDSPYVPLLPWLTRPWFNVGMLLSSNGLYLLLLLIGLVLVGALTPIRTSWFVVLLIAYAICFTFEYHSIWFWRLSFAFHFLHAIVLGLVLDRLTGSRRLMFAFGWCAILVPGLIETSLGNIDSLRGGPFTPNARAQAIHWIYDHTPLAARVVEFREGEASLVTEPDFLRTGNRAGMRPYDREHALVGYTDYMNRMKSLPAGIAGNDYIIASSQQRTFQWFLNTCGAPKVFQAEATAVYQVTDSCRNVLATPTLDAEFKNKQRELELLTSKETQEVVKAAEYTISHPEGMGQLRNLLEPLWAKSKFSLAATIMEPVAGAHPELAEAQYSYAFSLHCGRINFPKALEHYTAALKDGYSEFWVRYNRGSIYAELKDYAKAREELQRAQAINPDHPGPKAILGTLPKR